MSSALLKACLSSMRDALIVMDDKGCVNYWNPKATEQFGYTASEARGRYLHNLIVPSAYRHRYEAAKVEFNRYGTGRAVNKTVELEGLRRNGDVFPIELTLSSFQDDGRWFCVGVIRDLSEYSAVRNRPSEQEVLEQALSGINLLRVYGKPLEETLSAALPHLLSLCSGSAPQCSIYSMNRAGVFLLRATSDAEAAPGALQASISLHESPWGADAEVADIQAMLIPEAPIAQSPDGAGQTCAVWLPMFGKKQRLQGLIKFAAVEPPDGNTKFLNALQQLANSVSALIERYNLFQQNHRLRNIIEHNPVAITITDPQGVFEYVNKQFCQVTGYSRQEVIGQTPRLLSSGQTPPELYRQLWTTITQGEEWRGEICNRRKNGELFWESEIIWPVFEEGEIVNFVALKEDVTEVKQQKSQLETLATHDLLTGLPNEQLLRDRLEQALANAERDGDSRVMCVIDIKQMRLINESMGLSIGDGLLKELALRLKDVFRKADTLARLSGDAFAIVCCASNKQAIIDRVAAFCNEPFITPAADIRIDIYSGMVEIPAHGRDAETLLRRVTAAVHQGKSKGDFNTVFYTETLDSGALRTVSLTNDLRDALAQDQFRIWYQPKVNIRTGAVTGAEALIRWQHPQRGLVSPLEFIGLAESSGLIVEIGRWVIQEVIRQISVWEQTGQFNQPVSLNVSARQFSDPELLQTFEHNLRKYQVDPGLVEVEITESVLADDPVAVRSLLNEFAQLGLSIALDDYGTGYSSLAYISKLPIHTLKIDRAFIQGVSNNPQDVVIVKSTLAMCRDLGLKTVAEGVETLSQAAFVSRYGCTNIQGYLFSKPLAASEFSGLVKRGFGHIQLENRAEEVVVVLDDEQSILNAVRRTLRRSHYKLLLTTSPEEAMAWMAEYDVGVIITDQRMAAISGIEFLRKIKDAYPDTSRIVLSGYADLTTVTQAINDGAVFRFLSKPWNSDELINNIEDGFYYYNLRISSLQNEEKLNDIREGCHLSLSDLSVGAAEIDQQHGALIDAHNALTDAFFSEAEPSLIIDLYRAFEALSQQHFDDEEALMLGEGYPHLREHTEAHQALMAAIAKYRRRLEHDYASVNLYRLIGFVKSSIADHVVEHDYPFGQYHTDRKGRAAGDRHGPAG